ncbi:MAG TPA: ABC transporter permease [Pyrinomonadaceae bacterium]|nr:ABC transporter permease [Pyrinomonadaceae bacterium]
MGSILRDLRYGARTLAKQPGFAAVAVLTLALGIGANTAIFSVVNGVLLRPLPYREPERLLALRGNMSLPNLEDLKAQTRSFEAVGGLNARTLNYTGGGEPLQVDAGLVTADLFEVLGARAELGRTISAGEDVYGGERVVVLSHAFWQKHLGGDPGALGRTIQLSGSSYTIVGVLSPRFVSPAGNPEVWASVRVVDPVGTKFRGAHFLRTFWRLRDGATVEQAQGEIEAAWARLAEQHPAENRARRLTLQSLQERVVGDTRPALLILMGAVALVLLIACANYANLLLARSAARRHEVAIRAALGAGRGRIVRQMLTESVLLSVVGGLCGLGLASWGVDLLLALEPANLPRQSDIRLDWRVLAFTLGVSGLTGLVFGLAPAWNAARVDAQSALKEGGRGTVGGRSWLRGALVAAELALAVVLLVGAGLLVKSFARLRSVEPGFNPDNLLAMRMELPQSDYKEIPKQTEFRRRVLESLNTLPGVEAAMVSEIPLGDDSLFHNFLIEGRPAVAEGEEPELHSRTIGGDYFRVAGIPVVAGRALDERDREGAPLVGVVNESFARQYFGGGSPLGARVRWARVEGEPRWITVVGVVGDVKQMGLNQPEEPAIYTPFAQSMQEWKRWMHLVVRSKSDPATLTGAVKARVWSIDPQIPVTKVRTMDEVMSASVARQRFDMTLLAVFAAVALLLASVGIYGVVSYTVTQRTHEIGVRVALGAGRGDILRMVMGQGLALALAGVCLGVAGALALTRLLEGMLFGVGARDAATFALVPAALTAVALAACYLPARRATKVDPMVALRYE